MFSVKIAPARVDHSLVRGKFLVVTSTVVPGLPVVEHEYPEDIHRDKH